ncbi:PRC-barrel domain-containing protein [Sphingomonas sp.]|uniref:PRC-barrel domain-containing protein n=1 Tax=Sphingomonas sp. TaxID=28214 RepID=UPI003AFF6768
MTLADLAGWVAPAATMIAAMMTAANLGTRVTGWGFVVFTVGSLAWVAVAVASGQNNLLLSNAFLTLVNLVGIWRWLGRQARYEEGSKTATQRSAAAKVPTLFSAGSVIGAPVTGRHDAKLGTVVDAMMRCDGAGLAYLVIGAGGVGGVGERLHALPPEDVRFGHAGVACDLSAEELRMRTVLEDGAWPATV